MRNDVSQNIIVIPKAQYEPIHSVPNLNKFVHSYHIIIENHSNESVKLLSRYWVIVNAFGERREVEGPGVIGRQPIIGPGECYEYDSWSPMNTELGKMYGEYTMMSLSDKRTFKVSIPDFALNAAPVHN